MSSDYSILKKKNGDIIIFGGFDKEKPETIELENGLLLSFVEGFIEYLDADESESLLDLCETRLDEIESELSEDET